VVSVLEEGLPADFGKYRLDKRIATGGMAEIFLAHKKDAPLESLVIKRILPHLGKSGEFVSMFLDEARIAAQLEHPNVVRIHDVGSIEGAYYIAMEYVHGEDIRRIYNRAYKLQRSLPLSHSIRVIADAAEGLGYAHRLTDFTGKPMGVVHRDVSPQNILVTYDGHVKVVDFGIAKAANKVAQTRDGVLKGKYSYMSPEQALGDPIDHRTDIFALGIILYETTTGTRLFKRHNELATLQAIIKCEFVLPSEALPGYPPELEQVLLKALERRPEARFDDARELSKALYSFLRSSELFVERDVIAEFMRDLFGDRIEEEEGTGKPALPHPDEVREEMKDATTPMRQRPTDDEEPDQTESNTGVPRFASNADLEPSATAPEDEVDGFPRGGEKRKRTELIRHDRRNGKGDRPPPDQAPTVAAQPVFTGAGGEGDAVTIAPVYRAPPERSIHDRRRGEHTEQVRARRPKRSQERTEEDLEPVARGGLPRMALPAVIILGAIVIAILAGVLASRLLVARTERPIPEAPLPAPEAKGKLAVLTEPGSSIYAGGEMLGVAKESGEAGPFDVKAGAVVVRVANGSVGFEREREVLIEPGQNYQFEIRPRQGWLRLAIAPWARVTIDGKDLGLTPLPKVPLYEGVHKVVLENPDLSKSYQTSVRIQPGELAELKINLDDVGTR
jgi:serine/threonine-protein kinase